MVLIPCEKFIFSFSILKYLILNMLFFYHYVISAKYLLIFSMSNLYRETWLDLAYGIQIQFQSDQRNIGMK